MPISKTKEQTQALKLRGGMSLEAALVLAPCLILLTCLLFIFYAKLMALQVRSALENVAEEVALIFPLSDQVLEGRTGKAKELIDKILQADETSLLNSVGGDYASSLFLGPFLEKRLDRWLDQKAWRGGYPVLRHQRQMILHWGSGGKSLSLRLIFKIPTLLGDYTEEFSTLIPLWSQRLPDEQDQDPDQDEDREEDDIWSADNFSRGRYFREKEGANLPFNFPVLAYYQSGVAKSIKSMDLTAPSYQNTSYASEQIKGQIMRLQGFQSYESQSAAWPSIKAGEIRNRTLVLVIPENAPATYDRAFWQSLEQYASQQAVSLEVKPRGRSSRYAPEPESTRKEGTGLSWEIDSNLSRLKV